MRVFAFASSKCQNEYMVPRKNSSNGLLVLLTSTRQLLFAYPSWSLSRGALDPLDGILDIQPRLSTHLPQRLVEHSYRQASPPRWLQPKEPRDKRGTNDSMIGDCRRGSPQLAG